MRIYLKALSVLLITAFTSTTAQQQEQQKCNGHAELCNQPYNNLTYVLTHNSYAFMANPAANQECSITTQLSDGVRALKLSAVKSSDNSSQMQLCHTSCTILNAGPAIDTLTNITSWLKNNPNEVISIFWNFPNNDFFAADFLEPYKASGLLEYTHAQEPGNLTWPTLGDMIRSGKRVVTYLEQNADQSRYPWQHSEYDYIFETPYDNNNETSFRCTIDRPENPSQPTKMMYSMNHFLYGVLPWGQQSIQIPQSGSASTTNGQDSLMRQADQCTQTFGKQPNFLIVDFFNRGETLKIAAELNNVTYDPSTVLQCNKESAMTGGGTNAPSSAALAVDATASFLSSVVFIVFISAVVAVI
ncbi:PLC-like phosphodiesterase [Dichotomocladium elegans]|nr:PLC-like phosphodiesterase [Dichotomocladium elegans]